MSIRSLTYQQSVFKCYHGDKHFSEFLLRRWRQKINWHRPRYGTKLRHCHPVYCNDFVVLPSFILSSEALCCGVVRPFVRACRSGDILRPAVNFYDTIRHTHMRAPILFNGPFQDFVRYDTIRYEILF